MLQLQRVELEINRVNTAIRRLQSQIEETIKKMENLKAEREGITKRIEEIKKEIKKQREQIEECREKAKRAEERLNLVKKAEEYKALLREKAKGEDCVIKLSESIKRLEEELKRLEEKREDRGFIKGIQELEEELSDLRYSQLRLSTRLEGLQKELEELRSKTEESILEEYERLKKRHGLPIILPIDSLGACTNCGTKLPSALYSRLIAGEVEVCPSCGRLVYYEEQV